MNKTKLMFAAAAACIVLAGCQKKDFNAITGNTESTGVTLSSDPTSFVLHVRLVPLSADTTADSIHVTPAHEVPADSIPFDPIATLQPQETVIANGIQNMSFSFSHPVAEINGSQYIQGDTTGTADLTVTYTDVDHNFATTSITLPVTVTQVP